MKTTHLPCPSCPSSDAYSIQKGKWEGWGKCFSCGIMVPPDKVVLMVEETEQVEKPFSPLTKVFRGLPARGFTEDTIHKYGVDVGVEGAPYIAKYPVYNTEGKHIGNKVRLPEKKFAFEGAMNGAGLMGRQAFPAGGKYITVVEGQDDMLAAYQMMGSKWPVVSVHSASSAAQDCKRDFEYLNAFDNIVFAFDGDEAGRKAVKDVCNLPFDIGKIKCLTLRNHKDANDYLMKKEGELFVREWWQAPTYKPDGLKMGKDMLDEILNRPNHFAVPYPWEGLNKMTYGMRLSEAVLIMADTGVGKTSILKEIEYSLLMNPDIKEKGYGVGFLHLEEPNHDTSLGLLSIHDSKPYHLPDTPFTPDDIVKAHGDVLGDNRAVFYDHFGSNDISEILAKIRHMVALGCKYIVIDHLSIIVSDQSGDERKQLDEISTKLKTMTMELNIAVICVIHTNRAGMARGSAGPEKVANIHLSLYRDKKAKDEWLRNITVVTIEKNRFCGRTGPAIYLEYNPKTNRLTELTPDLVSLYEDGRSPRDDGGPWA
jgi:twinkle protein